MAEVLEKSKKVKEPALTAEETETVDKGAKIVNPDKSPKFSEVAEEDKEKIKQDLRSKGFDEPKDEDKPGVVEHSNDDNYDEEELSPWYYFFSQGCGWCKKSSPVVEELIDEGYDILMLDLAEPDNQQLAKELKEEYKQQCGTPWFINADTGQQICGFREKDILLKWLAGEEIPVPPRPTGPPPKVPFHGSTNKENTDWKNQYKQWLKDNEHMGENWVGNQRSASQILDNPRPKSDPPKPLMGQQLLSATDAQIEEWGTEWGKWSEENKHLPNLQPVDKVIEQMKVRRDQIVKQQASKQQQNSATANNNANINERGMTLVNTIDARVQALEVKLDRIISHFGVK